MAGFGERLGLAFDPAFLGNLVKLGLGAFDLLERRDFLAGVERAFDQVAADPDQRAKQRQIVDLLGEVAGADDRRARPGQLGKIGRPADFLHPFVRFEHRPQGHRVGDHVLVGQAKDRIVDPPVQRLGEMVRLELQPDILDQPVVDHQRAKQRRLRLDILGEGRGSGGLRRISDANEFQPWVPSYADRLPRQREQT